MEISEQWFSLTSGSGVQSLGIDLFQIQSSGIDRLWRPQVSDKASMYAQLAQACPTTNRESNHCFFLF